MYHRFRFCIFLLGSILVLGLPACQFTPAGQIATPKSTDFSLATSTIVEPTQTSTIRPTSLESTPDLSVYEFPELIEPAGKYIFYLHGRIVEEQGIHAKSIIYGEYEYEGILNALHDAGFFVISEPRPRNTDIWEYAEKIERQVKRLLDAKVPPNQITVVGASKGAIIAVAASYLLKNENIKFVLLAGCSPEMTENWKSEQVSLFGKVLSIYDASDTVARSCMDFFALDGGKGISEYDEIVLSVGTGHGILYKPLDEWMKPVIKWAK